MICGDREAAGDSGDGMRPRSGACGEAGDQSRLVIRDERTTDKPGASVERSAFEDDKQYESEIWRLEARGSRGIAVAHPVPLESANPHVAHVDWCAFTLRPPQFKTHLWIIHELERLFGFQEITPRNHGLYGYKYSAIIEDGGLIAWGGKNQNGTVYVSLNAQGCARIKDWIALREWCSCHNATITRLDLAHDDFSGKHASIELARIWYESGGFNAGGRKPVATLAGAWWGGDTGRTVYIGHREHGKLLRIYEKGKQQGDPASAWVRVELELHNKMRLIPRDALTRPGAYLAGAYPCLRFLSDEQSKIRTIRKAAKTSFKKSVEVARNQCGKLVNLMLRVHGGDAIGVVNELRREGIPSRLVPYSHELRNDPALVAALLGVPRDAVVVP